MSEPTPSSAAKVARTAAAGGAVLSLGAALVGPVPPAGAAPFTVTNADDSGDGSLRDAIEDANLTAEADTITFAPGVGPITLTSGEIPITEPLTITGPATISGDDNSRIFYIDSADSVTISGLTLQDGYAGSGGAIQTYNTDLTIEQTTITNSFAQGDGGGVEVEGGALLEIIDSTFSDNESTSDGGGLRVEDSEGGTPDVVVSGSTFSGNIADSEGGGLSIEDSADISIDTTTIGGDNRAEEGGGAQIEGGPEDSLTILSSTVSGNFALVGGGLFLDYVGTVDIAHSTFADNEAQYAGGAIFAYGTDTNTLDHVILGDNSAPYYDEIASGDDGTPTGPFTTSFSLIEGDSTPDIIDDVEGNIFGEDPALAALAANGGPNQTHALTASSPALDGGDPGFAPPPDSDQRGLPREQGEAIDIGAYETQPGEPVPPTEPPAAAPAAVTPTFTG